MIPPFLTANLFRRIAPERRLRAALTIGMFFFLMLGLCVLGTKVPPACGYVEWDNGAVILGSIAGSAVLTTGIMWSLVWLGRSDSRRARAINGVLLSATVLLAVLVCALVLIGLWNAVARA